MKLYFFLLLSVLLVNERLIAQVLCGTPTDEVNQSYTSLSRMKSDVAANESMICLNVYFHIIRKGDGSGTFRTYEINGILERLNDYFSPWNINFHKLGVDSIKNSLLYGLQPSETETLFSLNNQSNAINFYIVGLADGFNGFAQHILGTNLVLTDSASKTNVSSHEMGHCLNLFHTQHGNLLYEPASTNDSSACEELINGTNCDTCGDYICDTPADPGLRSKSNKDVYFVDNNCNYINNDGYAPDTRNIMSYSRPECLDHFTNQQAIRMRDAILNSPLLQTALSCSCLTNPLLLGKSTINSTENSTYSLSCYTAGSSIVWTCSSNLLMMNSDPSYRIVKPINSNINGTAFIKATVNGIPINRDIWIGKPIVDVQFVQLLPYSNYVELKLIGVNSDIEKQNITHIEWIKVSGSGFMGNAINSIDNLAHGSGSNWIVEANIIVSNDCGTTIKPKTITPPPPLPCDDSFMLIETAENIYQEMQIIDPCDGLSTEIGSSSKLTKSPNVTNAELIDLNWNKLKIFNTNYFDLRFLKTGVYIMRVQLENKILTQKVYIQ